MIPIPKEQVQKTAQVLLSTLSDERCVTPNNLIEGVVSGKSLLRALISGQLVICAPNPANTPPAPEAPAEPSRADEGGEAAPEA